MSEQVTLEGVIQSIVFQNEENGYTVMAVESDDHEITTVVGCIPYAFPGEEVTITGNWTFHSSYGKQLTVDFVERRLPTTAEGMQIYLGSGAVKGIGPATANRIVDKFGTDALRVIEDHPEKLQTIRGITEKRAKEISEDLRSRNGLRRCMDFLAKYELPAYLAMPIYKNFGADAVQFLQNNPYLLVGERYGIEFSVVDEIALSMGFDGDDSCRVEAAILYELNHNLNNGHVFLPREKLIDASAQLIGTSKDVTEKVLDNLLEKHIVVGDYIAKVNACYLASYFEAETFVAKKLVSMCDIPQMTIGDVEKILQHIEKEQGIEYAEAQKNAVRMAATKGIMLLTGGPGTGKTTSVRGIKALFERMGLNILLLAPTGRAAKRLGELCGSDAQTIHRCLGMSFNDATGEITFRKNEKEPLETDAVIIDEMSMVDLKLMQALLKALRPGCRIVMVGDPDQLPSVGAGNVFDDLIRSGVIPVVALHEVFRQAEKSAIIRNAHRVNEGASPNMENNQGDFFFMCRRASDRLVQTVVELCKTRLPENMHIPPEEIQVLSATRKGECGTVNLNKELQRALNPAERGKKQKHWGDMVFREGDRVMQIRNNYDVLWQKDDGSIGTGIFNGDMGVIEEIDSTGELITIRFDDRVSTYTSEQLGELDMAYAVTVHKAQGSEYRAVILVSSPVASSLMVRGVLYTAITRAKELLIMVGDDVVPGQMAANDRQQRRYSGLRRRVKQLGECL